MKAGQLVLSEKRETTGPAVSFRLTADPTEIDADGEDVAVLKVEGLDLGRKANGRASGSPETLGKEERE